MKLRNKDFWYQKLIAPRGATVDERRRELILNTILCGLTAISLSASGVAVANYLYGVRHYARADSAIALIIFLLLVTGLWFLSRKGFYKFSSYVILGFVLLGATQFMLAWSFELPMTQMVFALLVVMSGVLLSARSALMLTFIISFYVLLVSYYQAAGRLKPDTRWLNQELQIGGAIGFVGCLLVIGLVSWLANREIDRSLERARRSEAALELERDQLEVKVVERTRQLEQTQLLRVMELQRLAEFGRLSAGLLHDVADPLTAASLNLKELGNKSQSLLLKRALQSLGYIERFLEAARKQLKSQGSVTNFVVMTEIKQVLSILKHRTREAAVSIKLEVPKRYTLSGDPVKFNQILANLILNAIEAYDEIVADSKEVKISLKQEASWLKLMVSDHGRGLDAGQIERIFEPFYTTKAAGQPNMGIGLATVKQLVEKDFGGTIKVTSSAHKGTRFTIWLRSKNRTKS